ncbi:hypothetical protein [Flavobacterium sp.]|uniref:hypothetical protein n=1 Tax=Flavobacterium sp. TaxID=239 RepID=UPI0025C3E80A|nr:hypothetical protein [Flavobacterium sp.]MBA4153668.1 hypothetical protein [Flavobacterium sp.]
MKNILLYLVLIFSIFTYSQKKKDKEILLISTQYYGQKCQYVAFKLSTKQVEIDNCYNSATGFNVTKIIPLKSESVLQTIYKMSTSTLKDYQKRIDSVKNCDTLSPIKVRVNENETLTNIKWKSLPNCYPQSVRNVIKPLEDLFVKYK